MRFFDWIEKFFKFNRDNAEFELLETERGTPDRYASEDYPSVPVISTKQTDEISSDLKKNRVDFIKIFHRDINSDAIFRSFITASGIKGLAIYINGMIDSDRVNDFLIRPLVRKKTYKSDDMLLNEILNEVLEADEVSSEKKINKIVDAIASGQAAFFIDGLNSAIIADVRGFKTRSIGESEGEKCVLGPKEAFTENLRTSITQLRRIIKSPDLVAEFRVSDTLNKGTFAIIYLAGKANMSLVDNIKRKLAAIDTTLVLDVGTVAQFLEKPKYMPLPKILLTEKPDITAAHILQGHIAIVIDGSPEALVLPATLPALMATTDDVYLKGPLGSILKTVCYLGAFLSLILPGAFLGMSLYHQGMLSTEVLLTIITSRKMVYMPLGYELLLLLLVFHFIREASMRVPGGIGQAIGIIGGIMLGQAAVSANLVSTTSLIVVSLSGLGNFCIPNFQLMIASTWARILLLLAAWAAGFMGLFVALLIIIAAVASTKSFGVPFLSPYAPKTMSQRPPIFRGVVKNHTRGSDYTNVRGDRRI